MAMATAALARAMRGGSGAGAGLAAGELLSKAPATRTSSLPAMVVAGGEARTPAMTKKVKVNCRPTMTSAAAAATRAATTSPRCCPQQSLPLPVATISLSSSGESDMESKNSQATVVASRGCSNGGGRCAKVADLAEMNGRINMVEFELKREVQLMKFAVEKQRAMARVEMMEAEANRMQFRFRLMCGLVWGGSLVYIASHRY
ncbi:hypothetical protein OsI_24941 [Oryza sativa Indica Group]|uniref:Uncharacterized protein n=1 Tax=Oryza sativa subsp. indica TaxID=39946 RepID=B8B7D0_ORYSI|nr:hypothetical protein OsI_24941 [Oryza sativa Indica Group]